MNTAARRPRPLVKVVSAMLPCTLVLGACGGSGGSGDGGDGGDTTIRYAMSDFGADSLDPAMEQNDQMLTKFLMWDSLIEIGPDGELAPGIAESWELSKDGLEWTFELREGVKFHNGEDLTADDVKFSIERAISEEAASSNAAQARDQISEVEMVDDYTIVVHTNGIQVDLPYQFSTHRSAIGVPLPKDYLLEEGGETFEEQRELLETAPVGSGPFEFVSRQEGESVLYEAVEDHWRQTPEIDRVEILEVSEAATQVSMLQAGEVDVITAAPDQVETLEGAGYGIRPVEDSAELVVMFPGVWRPGADQEPANDPRVRQALSLAIDRDTIINAFLSGYGRPKTTPYNTSVGTSDIDEADWTEWSAEANAYDPDRARELLAEAGYPDGFDGMKLFTFPFGSTAALTQMGEIVADQWSKIGVDAEIVVTDYTTFRPSIFQADPNDTSNLGDAHTYGNPPRFDAIAALRAYVTYKAGNFQLTRDDELDALVDEATNTIDDEERAELIRQAYQIFVDEWVTLEIASADSLFAVNEEKVGDWRTIAGYPYLGRTFETIQAP